MILLLLSSYRYHYLSVIISRKGSSDGAAQAAHERVEQDSDQCPYDAITMISMSLKSS